MRIALNVIIVMLLTCFPTTASHAAAHFEATVVDAQTRQPLPFASIYVSRTSSTISNAVGTFSIKCDSADVLRISYVGYKTLTIRASRLPRQVGLQPMENQLNEVVVRPVDLKKLIRKTTTETRRQLRKYSYRQSSFFYRQITFADSTCIELMEAFLQAKSAVYLQDMFLQKGRFAGIQPDSLHRYAFWTNFFTVSELPMLTRYDIYNNTDAKPLTRNYEDFYDLDYDVIFDDTGRLVVVHFIPKPYVTDPILDVKLYIDEKTYRLRKMEGEKRYVPVVHKEYEIEMQDTLEMIKITKSQDFQNFNLTVNMTEERGFLEVQSVYIDSQYMKYGKLFNTRSILFNVGDQTGSKEKKLRVYGNGDLHNYILEQGYDQQFWHDNEVIRRTPVEQKVMELFEHQNLFGVFE